MQPPIPLGTLLQQRYRVTKILGQGGFGRTYLAQDTACFDESCVLKEFTPNDRGREALKKSKELFQREAEVLYQIDHPQIPKFRANFEEQRRLFLVQEYAEGKTVARTLSERLKNGKTFTETEAVEFLNNMLPVLAHIHGMGIIHRDISPDNIIFRDRDKVPVLIDFGVVKSGVTQLEASTQIHQGTTVGKAGYAPGEQLQTGEAYANSDLYALAVTVVVMMTGRKPESLIDKTTMTWKWHQWVPTLTPWFAKILNKMLSRAPNNRYQSATEVFQALRSVSELVGAASPASGTLSGNVPTPTSSGSVAPPRKFSDDLGQPAGSSVPLSRMKRSSANLRHRARPAPPQPSNPLRGILSSPWGMAVSLGTTAVLVLLVPMFLLSKIMGFNPDGKISTPNPASSPTPTVATTTAPAPTPAPTVSADPVATPAPTPTTAAATVEALALEVGKPTVKEGTLDATSRILSANLAAGQQLKVTLISNPAGATMNIIAPNQTNDALAKSTVSWEGALPANGDYRIEIVPPLGSAATNYKVELTATATAAPTVTIATPTPVTTPGAVNPAPANPTPASTALPLPIGAPR